MGICFDTFVKCSVRQDLQDLLGQRLRTLLRQNTVNPVLNKLAGPEGLCHYTGNAKRHSLKHNESLRFHIGRMNKQVCVFQKGIRIRLISLKQKYILNVCGCCRVSQIIFYTAAAYHMPLKRDSFFFQLLRGKDSVFNMLFRRKAAKGDDMKHI